MRKGIFSLAFALVCVIGYAQTTENVYQNSADKMIATDGKLSIGGYAQIDYNQPLSDEVRYNGVLDVHRLVLLFGYRFNERAQFITEVEYEHVSEVYVEQAFLQYKINNWLNFRGGLMLIPMGIVNEYHEPTTYNGVERPFIDNVISPTTWREMGLGFAGTSLPASIKYQLYLVNGFNGYNGAAQLGGKNGLRKGRQKGAESFISSPNFSGKVEYYGIKGLNIGLSGYLGKTQSTLYNGIAKDDELAMARADSSVIGLAMLGLDARYSVGALQLRGQYYYASQSNTEEYNQFTRVGTKENDLGSAATGYYAEVAYNVMRHFESVKSELVPFVRYEGFNTHQAVAGNLVANDAYKKSAVVAGLGWKPIPGVALKADMQWVKSDADTKAAKAFNAGIGIFF
jgi:hypothetical protein